jgi:hypothetical protein
MKRDLYRRVRRVDRERVTKKLDRKTWRANRRAMLAAIGTALRFGARSRATEETHAQ